MLIHFGLHDARKIGQSWPAAVNLLLSSANRLLHTPSRCFSFRLMELLQTISFPKRKHQHSWKLEGLISITEVRCQQHQQQFLNKNPWTEHKLHFVLACLKKTNNNKPTAKPTLFLLCTALLDVAFLFPIVIDFQVREEEINLLLLAALLLRVSHKMGELHLCKYSLLKFTSQMIIDML